MLSPVITVKGTRNVHLLKVIFQASLVTIKPMCLGVHPAVEFGVGVSPFDVAKISKMLPGGYSPVENSRKDVGVALQVVPGVELGIGVKKFKLAFFYDIRTILTMSMRAGK